ncbi:hypothetical protein [Streptomyces flaveolus]|uniref:hypothetical protein n=1 Tax=Streptomyces flaveolus TaxID=67297 RepID=UPI0033FADE9E
MTAITKIVTEVHTSGVETADTRSAVWLGLAGREFRLSTGGKRDFSIGAETTFILGEGSNVENAERNDPRNPALDTADLDRYPVYIRMDGSGTEPHWCLEDVKATVNPGQTSHEFTDPRLDGRGDGRRIWLDNPFGTVLHLRRTAGIAETRRIVRGIVDANGNERFGDTSEFEARRASTGYYEITFPQPFATIPTIVAMAWASNASLQHISTDRAAIGTHNYQGQAVNTSIRFIAIG